MSALAGHIWPPARDRMGGTTYGAKVIDPLAFIPGAHVEAGERGGGEAPKGEEHDD
jgi:hypothetical protein